MEPAKPPPAGNKPYTVSAPRPEAVERQDQSARDDAFCWICASAVVKRHCKIICPNCGFTRDCSDP